MEGIPGVRSRRMAWGEAPEGGLLEGVRRKDAPGRTPPRRQGYDGGGWRLHGRGPVARGDPSCPGRPDPRSPVATSTPRLR